MVAVTLSKWFLTGWDWVIVLIVPVGAYVLGKFRKARSTNYVDFSLARRSIGDWNFLAAFFGANLVFTAIFLLISYETVRRGALFTSAVPIAFALGVLLLFLLYGKLEAFFSEGKTLHQAFQDAYGKTRIRKLCALWTILAFVGMVSIEFYGGILLLRWCGLPLLNSIVIAYVLAAICAAFTNSGGLRGVTKVDLFLDLVSLAGICVFAWVLLQSGAGHALLHPTIPSVVANVEHAPPSQSDNWTFVFAALVLFVPMPLCALDTWQRGVAWKRQGKKIGKMLAFGAFAICGVTFVAMLAGAYAGSEGWDFSSFYPFRYVLDHLAPQVEQLFGGGWPFKGLVIAGFLAAIFSTADELLNCSAYATLSDIYLLDKGNDEETQRKRLLSMKFYTGFFTFLAATLATIYSWTEAHSQLRIQDFFYAVGATQVVFFVPLIIALVSKTSVRHLERSAYWSMILGFATAMLCACLGGFVYTGKTGRTLLDAAPIFALIASIAAFFVFWGVQWLANKRRISA